MLSDPATFERSPLLLFWETTRACPLACVHCRASAVTRPLPGELSPAEGAVVVDQAAAFDLPPLLVLTGGDPLLRSDLLERIRQARDLGLRVSVAPAVSPRLGPAAWEAFRSAGVLSVSLSLDGATPETHDGIRREPGTWKRTLVAFGHASEAGVRAQANTVVLRRNVEELADVFATVRNLGAFAWEVFFLVRTGRGVDLEELTPWEYEQVCHFLYDAAGYGVAVRTTEGPQFRRVVRQREEGTAPPAPQEAPLYHRLRARLKERCGPPHPPRVRLLPTRDGRGIVFVSHEGTICPSGFLPLATGNVRRDSLVRTYRESSLFRSLRDSDRLKGRCGRCAYRDLCGGSRARAYAVLRDPLDEDVACPFVP